MLDRNIADVLGELYSRHAEEQGDWERNVVDAGSRSHLPRFPAPGAGRLALAFATIALLAMLAVVPALAVSEGWWFLGFDAPNPTGTVAAAVNLNGSWTLIEYMSGNSICYAFAPGSGSITGVCGAGALGEANLPDSGATFGTTPGFVFGPAVAEVATVEVELDDGSVVTAKTVTNAVTNLRTPMRFYIVELPVKATATQIVGKDGEGQVIGTITVPDGTKANQGS
jgi:hypothetical protein